MHGLVSARIETARELLAMVGKAMRTGARLMHAARYAAKCLGALGSLVLRSWLHGTLRREETRVLNAAVSEAMREVLRSMKHMAKRGTKVVRGTRSSGIQLKALFLVSWTRGSVSQLKTRDRKSAV